MVGRIIGFICCALCAVPFLFVKEFNNKKFPISFWSGDNSLKDKVKNIEAYNKEMSSLYIVYGSLFLVAGFLMLFDYIIGIIFLCVCCTCGIYIVYLIYKKILKKYS